MKIKRIEYNDYVDLVEFIESNENYKEEFKRIHNLSEEEYKQAILDGSIFDMIDSDSDEIARILDKVPNRSDSISFITTSNDFITVWWITFEFPIEVEDRIGQSIGGSFYFINHNLEKEILNQIKDKKRGRNVRIKCIAIVE